MDETQNEPAEHYEFDSTERPEPMLTGHAWRQRGPWVVCTSCPFEHSFAIEYGFMLTGIDEEGYPILTRIHE